MIETLLLSVYFFIVVSEQREIGNLNLAFQQRLRQQLYVMYDSFQYCYPPTPGLLSHPVQPVKPMQMQILIDHDLDPMGGYY